LGLILLWLRPAKVWLKAIGSLLIVLIGIAHLWFLYGMRIELRGGGTPAVTFRESNSERHIAELERSRTEAAPVQPVETAAPAPVEAVKPEPAAAAAAAPSTPWPDYRGAQRDGVYRQGPILTSWPSSGLQQIYKQPIGGGYASFVIADGRAYTIEQRREKEFVVAYDFATGREVWTHSYPALFEESMGGPGPRATPTYHEGLIYSLGATGEMRVLDAATGAVKWSKNILTENGARNVMWGMCGAPLIVDEMVIVQPGGPGGKSIVAYDKKSGKRVWSVLDDQAGYVSAMLVTLGGKRQVITITAKRAVGLKPEDGTLLWEYPWVTEYDVNSAQPVLVDANRLIVSSGYGHGAALVELTAKAGGEGFTAKTVWENKRMKNRFSSSVLHDGYLYGFDESILACLRVSDGNQMWKGGRYGYGQLLLAEEHLVVLSESGEVALLKASPDAYTEVAKFEAIEGKTWNVPAMADGMLLVRNTTEMALFRIGK
jgi:outer membrane protein assembly factor BamB